MIAAGPMSLDIPFFGEGACSGKLLCLGLAILSLTL